MDISPKIQPGSSGHTAQQPLTPGSSGHAAQHPLSLETSGSSSGQSGSSRQHQEDFGGTAEEGLSGSGSSSQRQKEFGETAEEGLTSPGRADDLFDMESCLNKGQRIQVEWDGKTRGFIDGFGLCSPTRWMPSARGVRRPEVSRKLAADTFSLLASTVQK